MQKIIFSALINLISVCFSQTDTELSDRIMIDGISDDFTTNENILSDLDGSLLESPLDSYWGEYNDVKQIKATWDASYLYIAVDACSWENSVLLFIDVDNSYGIQDMNQILLKSNNQNDSYLKSKHYCSEYFLPINPNSILEILLSSSDTGSTNTSSGGVFLTKRKRSQPRLYAEL